MSNYKDVSIMNLDDQWIVWFVIYVNPLRLTCSRALVGWSDNRSFITERIEIRIKQNLAAALLYFLQIVLKTRWLEHCGSILDSNRYFWQKLLHGCSLFLRVLQMFVRKRSKTASYQHPKRKFMSGNLTYFFWSEKENISNASFNFS